jgi:HNH endonuclease
MRPDEREALRQRYGFRCGYCGVHETDVGAELTVDHFQPQSRGGPHAPANWVYCCHACNEFKSDYWQPASTRRLLHPLNDNLTEHIIELEDGTLQPQSEIGAFHIEWLHLNRRQLVAYRRERRLLAAARQEQMQLLDQLKDLEARVTAIMNELSQIRDKSPK